MAVTSGFFNSLYGDRKYTAEQFSALFNGLINDGVFSNIGTAFRVSATTENVISIGIGRAWFNGIWVNNDALLPMTCNDPEVLLDRIDAVVIEINRSEAVRAGRIIFVKGTASGTPVNPTLTHDESVDQYPLAYIRRKAGVSAVVQADITNCIGTSACPYVTGILETQNIDSIVAQWESQFNLWFDGLQTELEGDVAANLASQIISLDMRFDELAKTRTVTVELEDSSLDTIEDSTGAAIYGSTVLESEGSGTIVVEPTKEPEEVDGFEVGDILTTIDVFPGSKWRLCNGATLNRNDYPSLSSKIKKFPSATVWGLRGSTGTSDVSGTVATGVPKRMMMGDDYAVIGVYDIGSTTLMPISGFARLCYNESIDRSGTWPECPVGFDEGQGPSTAICDMLYANGFYIAVGEVFTALQESSYARIWYTGNPSISWSYKDVWSSDEVTTINRDHIDRIQTISYCNEYFIVGGVQSYGENNGYGKVRIAFTKNIASTWTIVDLEDSYNANYVQVNSIIYAEGKYIVAFNYNDLEIRHYCRGIKYAENLNGPWTTLITEENQSLDWSLHYINEQYILLSESATTVSDSAGSYSYAIAVSDTLEGITLRENRYTIKPTVQYNGSSNSGPTAAKKITYANGLYMILSMYNQQAYDVYYTEDVNNRDGWASTRVISDLSLNTIGYGPIEILNTNDGYYFATQSTGQVRIVRTLTDSIRIPSISPTNYEYSFIKVEE